MRKEWSCSNCGSVDVVFDAKVKWSSSEGNWEVWSVLPSTESSSQCTACGVNDMAVYTFFFEGKEEENIK